MDLTVMVVSYNTCQLTLECIASVLSQTKEYEFEIVVVDNRSTDGSCEAIRKQFPQVNIIESQTNLGFAKANNLAAERANGSYLLLLNPDTVVLDGAIDRLMKRAMELPEKSILGGRTVFADGSLNPTSCWGAPTLWSTFCFGSGLSPLGSYLSFLDTESMRRWKRDTTREVDIITGCYLLISKSVWDTLGGFDPEFHMYGEDFDLCMRARNIGIRCVFFPDSCIVHYGSASETVKADQLVRQMKAKAQLMRKHWTSTSARIGVALLASRVYLRAHAPLMRFSDDKRLEQTKLAWEDAWRRRREWI